MTALGGGSGKIAFVSNLNDNQEIFLGNLLNGEISQLTFINSNSTNPSWSPDGRNLVISSDLDGDEEIYILNLDGEIEKKITNNQTYDSFPAWSPSMESIVYIYMKISFF